MQKIVLLLPLVCLIFCVAQDSLEAQNLIYTRTHPVKVVKRVSTDFSYLCPENYVYLVRDFQVFNGVVCVEITITDFELQKGDCSPGWTTISENEVSGNPEMYCNMLGSGDVARIELMGSFTYKCAYREFDLISKITQNLCVKRKINDVMLVPLKDDVCGEGMVLVALQEALVNQDAYCNLLGENDVVRLADGGSMMSIFRRGGFGCGIFYEDRRNLSAALCRALKNSEPNENEDMFIPDATFNLEQPLDFQGGWI